MITVKFIQFNIKYMNGRQIDDCITNLNKLLTPGFNLTDGDRAVLLRFFIEAKISSVTVLKPETFLKVRSQIPFIKRKKEALLGEKPRKYEELARLRESEKHITRVIQMVNALKQENTKASFAYGVDGLCLYIIEGEYDFAIQGLKDLGLRVYAQIFERHDLPKVEDTFDSST
jgi:hypothetical protein